MPGLAPAGTGSGALMEPACAGRRISVARFCGEAAAFWGFAYRNPGSRWRLQPADCRYLAVDGRFLAPWRAKTACVACSPGQSAVGEPHFCGSIGPIPREFSCVLEPAARRASLHAWIQSSVSNRHGNIGMSRASPMTPTCVPTRSRGAGPWTSRAPGSCRLPARRRARQASRRFSEGSPSSRQPGCRMEAVPCTA